jgi:hypothetical protein
MATAGRWSALISFLEKRFAAESLFALCINSIVWPVESIARSTYCHSVPTFTYVSSSR